MPEAWRPKVLYNKGRLSTRQFQAALALRSDWLCAGLACDNPVDLAERRGAAHRFDVAIGWLGRTTRAVIEAVVLRGESCEAAGRLPVIAGLYRGGWSERPRAFAAAAFLADGLNELADRYGLPA